MPFNYDVNYLENLLEMYAGSMEQISNIRWQFIAPVEAKLVLDYGSGNNAFSLFKPDDVIVDSFDIGTIGSAPYPQTGIKHEHYDLICLWDVIEHIDWKEEPDEAMLDAISKVKYLAATIPVLPDDQVLEDWKHYKPGEHLTYFNTGAFIGLIESLGFSLQDHGQPECPPRKDIHSFLFTR